MNNTRPTTTGNIGTTAAAPVPTQPDLDRALDDMQLEIENLEQRLERLYRQLDNSMRPAAPDTIIPKEDEPANYYCRRVFVQKQRLSSVNAVLIQISNRLAV